MESPGAPDPLQAVLELAKTCEYEVNHSHQVTRLALRLFDELLPLHHLGAQERSWLQYAGILHDIGWVEGWKEHHKVSLRIILTAQLLPFANKERLIIGSIARYHRRAMPNLRHDHYSALKEDERLVVNVLAGILRIADGLDNSHQNRVRDVACKISPRKITLRCLSPVAGIEEQNAAIEKSDLLALALKRKISLQWIEKA